MIFYLWRKFRRWRLSRRPFPERWVKILETSVPFFQLIPREKREDFFKFLKLFAWEKTFIGAKGMKITDEVRVTISAAAARLILYLDISYYDRLTEIIVYPFHYRHPDQMEDGGKVFFGEAHTWGIVVLSWPAVRYDILNTESWQDTATHEFAHALDIATGQFDGTPKLRKLSHYKKWSEVMEKHFQALRQGDPLLLQLLTDYAALNEAEFFAVSTELFFGNPLLMKKNLPELFEILRTFYGWTPPQPEPPFIDIPVELPPWHPPPPIFHA